MGVGNIFMVGGSNFCFNAAVPAPGVWQQEAGSRNNNNVAGRVDTYGWGFGTSTGTGNKTPIFPNGPYTSIWAGLAVKTTDFSAGTGQIITFYDAVGNVNCDLRCNTSGLMFFTRNGTVIGSSATVPLVANAWQYVEVKVIFATSATGTMEVKVNGVTFITSTSIQTAVTNANCGQVSFVLNGSSTSQTRDFYVDDTGYEGDISVVEIYDNDSGTATGSSPWPANIGPFTLTSVNNAGVYQGTITGGGSGAYAGYYFTITGFVNGANNVTALCTNSSATSLTFAITTVSETHAGSAAFQSVVQLGIHGGVVDGGATTGVGIRPPGDNTYVSDSTSGNQILYGHQTLTLTGTIVAVAHLTNARKDDAGARNLQQVTKSGGTTHTGASVALNNSYTYLIDIMNQDPNTSAAWTVSNFNSATNGVKSP